MLARLTGLVLAALLAVLPAAARGDDEAVLRDAAAKVRAMLDAAGRRSAEDLAKHVPEGILETLGEPYEPGSPEAVLDVFRPAGAGPLPTVVWIHGGAWLAGSREHVADYLRILASHGFATVGLDYTLAPGARYPSPVRQANAALAHLRENAERLGVDMERVFLAGDSAGAQVAGQLANVLTSPAYARRMAMIPALPARALRGAALFRGIFDARATVRDGALAGFLSTVGWAYFGVEAFYEDPRMNEFSVIGNLTQAFPPLFLTVGNGDPLEPQSHALMERAEALGVPVDYLFFPRDHQPPLPHAFQFDLDRPEGLQALARLAAFLHARSDVRPTP